MNFSKRIFLMLVVSCFFVGCNKSSSELIILDNSNPLQLALDVSWAVVTEPYATYKVQMGWDAGSNGYVRHADILKVKGKSVDDNGDVWYLFEEGWLPENSIAIYNNHLRAKKASNILLEN